MGGGGGAARVNDDGVCQYYKKSFLKSMTFKFITKVFSLLLLPLCFSAAHAANGDWQVAEYVAPENPAYAGVAELTDKYETEKKLPEGQTCSKSELVDCLLPVLKKIAAMYEKGGPQAMQRDDLETINNLIAVLDSELEKRAEYRAVRQTINRALALIEPAVPLYKYKFGVNGLTRGEGSRSFNLSDFGHDPGNNGGQFLYRVKPYVHWHPTDYVFLHLEGQGYGTMDGSEHDGEYSLYQGFVEARLPEKSWFDLKAGRQEFNYGSSFILGPDAFYDGLSFDAGRLSLRPYRTFTVDVLGGRYATPVSGGVEGELWGAYVTYADSEDNAIEAYAFRDTGSTEDYSGERLDTLGIRSVHAVGVATLEMEPVYQTGRVRNPATGRNDRVNAFGGHIDLTAEITYRQIYNPRLFYSPPVIFLSYAIGSGSKEAARGGSVRKEFHNPNNDTSLVGDMGFVGDFSGLDIGDHHASGMQIYNFGVSLDFTRKLSFTATGRKFVADVVEDGFSRDVGVEADFTLTYIMHRDLTFLLGYDHFFAGKFFRDAVGSRKDMNYAYAMIVFNYERTKRKLLDRGSQYNY